MPLAPHPLPDLHAVFGFGVAGNFAGHLEQAGEAADFAGVAGGQVEAPKGIFPWYVPGHAGREIPEFLRQFPLSHDRLLLPPGAAELKVQIEPEVAVLFAAQRDSGGAVVGLEPIAIGAFNDCSIRRPGARKISEKKNWGPASKGLAPLLLATSDLSASGPTASWRLACFLRREGRTEAYGVDSRLPDYSYYGEELITWLIERLAHQEGGPQTPLEPVGSYLRQSGAAEHLLVGIGATRYTPLGETTFLEAGDEAIVVVYDAADRAPEEIASAVAAGREAELTAASVLVQRVEQG